MFEVLVGRKRYSRDGGSNRDHLKASILSMLPSSSYRIAEEETVDVLAPAAATTCGVLFHLRFLFVSGMCRMFLVGAHLERGKDGHWGRRWRCHHHHHHRVLEPPKPLHVPGGFQERRNRRFRRERCNIVLVVSDSKARSWGLQGSSGQGWLRSRCEFVVIFKTALCH